MSVEADRRWVCRALAAGAVGAAMPAAFPSVASAFDQLRPGRWTAIHTMDMASEMAFPHQRHAGGAYDSRRHRIALFGSDTHGNDWTNTPFFFDLATLIWSRAYPSDRPSSYAVDDQGLPVAGAGGRRPWAMHTFGAVTYDPEADILVVASHPAHLEPGRFTDAMASLWPRIRTHPTWVYRMATGIWEPFALDSVSFFARATVFDTHRGVTVGIGHGMNTFSPGAGGWSRPVVEQPPLPWGMNGVYDSRQGAVIAFGSHAWSNDVAVHESGSDAYRIMPTPGRRPPPTRYTPMAYHARLGKVVALVQRFPEDGARARVPDHRRRAETWLYVLETDSWEKVPEAELPFGWYMNYKLFYVPPEDALVLIAQPPGEPTTVFALRL